MYLWFEYLYNCWTPGIFTHSISRVAQNYAIKKNIQWAAILKVPCWLDRFTHKGQTGSSWQKGYRNSNNNSVQLWWAEKHLWMHNKLNLAADGLQQHKTRKLRLQWPQAQLNWTVKDWKNAAWSDESQFLLETQMVGSELGTNGMNSQTQPALCHKPRLVEVV